MSIQETTTLFCAQKNILANGQHYVSVPVKIDATKVVANAEGKKLVPLGSIISKAGVIVNDATAYGITLNQADVTIGPEGIATVIHGYIYENELPVAPSDEALAAMKQITLI